MPKHPPETIIQYLVRLDGFLSNPVPLVVIGGFAIALRWSDRHSTADIDVLGNLDPALQQAIQAAGPENAIPIQAVTVGSQPYTFEDRLQPLQIPGLQRLQIFVPDAHDLAIMKMARGLSHDLEGIEEIHGETPLELETLLDRYRETDHIGNPDNFKWALLATVARLFGSDRAEYVAKTL
jgi:hypothetical protein